MNLSKLNPNRHLFSRLFLWFWVTLVISVLTAGWLGRLLADNVDVREARGKELAWLESGAKRIRKVHEVRPSMPLDSVVRVAHKRGATERFVTYVLFNPASGDLVTGPGRVPFAPFAEENFRFIKEQGKATVVSRGLSVFIGIETITLDGQEWWFLVQRPSGRPMPLQKHFGWLILGAVLISGLFCFLFARSLVKPIERLQDSTKKLAEGGWQTRVDEHKFRRDEIGQLVKDFNAMADQLERAWQRQQRLLADVSHELRSPLARLQMAIGLIEQEGSTNTSINRIEREAERMEMLINRLLQLTRVEGAQPAFERISVSDLLAETLNDAAFEAQQNNKVLPTPDFPECTVTVNRELFLSGVENIIRNAIRYANGNIQVQLRCLTTHWEISIADDGPGLQASEYDAIFRPFYRPTEARDRASGGAGLGLAIAKAVVDLHDGDIQAAQSSMGGLIIRISLPLHGPHQCSGKLPEKTS